MTHINSIEAFINPRVITFIDCGMALKKYTSEMQMASKKFSWVFESVSFCANNTPQYTIVIYYILEK